MVSPTWRSIVVPQLADSLAALADEGSRVFYEGELAAAMVAHTAGRGGLLTREDLRDYAPLVRDSLQVELGPWTIATNPPPAIGGAVLAAMLLAFERQPIDTWDAAALLQLVRVQQAALSYRKRNLDLSDDLPRDARKLLELARSGELLAGGTSGATVHTSAVDRDGLACAITASSGYGSGEMPAGTGLWLNNCMGELELNRRGFEAGPPGVRLPSNMAPTAARRENGVLAIGSPGADRITTALHQFLVNYLQLGLELADAVAHPRLHLELGDGPPNIAADPLPEDRHVFRRRGCRVPRPSRIRRRCRPAPRGRHLRRLNRAALAAGMPGSGGSANLPFANLGPYARTPIP